MKITFLIPSLNGGGAEKVTTLLANELVEKGYEVTFLMCRLEGPYMRLLHSNIHIVQLRYPSIAKNVLSIRKYLILNEVDIFYSSMNYVNVIASIGHFLAKSNSKLILSDHNNITSVIENYIGNKFIFKKLLRFTYPMAEKVVCVSKGVEAALNKEFNNVITQVIYNPIEMFKANYHKDTTNFNILNIGRLAPQKNQNLLIKAFHKVVQNNPDLPINLTILGEGDLRPTLEQLVNELGLSDRVSLPGFSDLQTYLDKAHLFILSSDREGFGNVIVEALSSGLPVISTDCPSGPSEILDNGKYGQLTPVGNVDVMAKAIQNALKDDNLLTKEKMDQRIERANDFAADNIAEDYHQLFISL